ncbi:hypothetical protein [Leeia oryzae]|uniref:hypothetical protein n=1 Tax=Leeia oryzae TaxID=356662 RepID=UPI00037B5FBF|nr:hypothetical protein [Leeia oryzae]
MIQINKVSAVPATERPAVPAVEGAEPVTPQEHADKRVNPVDQHAKSDDERRHKDRRKRFLQVSKDRRNDFDRRTGRPNSTFLVKA